jgi:hypothetical protein
MHISLFIKNRKENKKTLEEYTHILYVHRRRQEVLGRANSLLSFSICFWEVATFARHLNGYLNTLEFVTHSVTLSQEMIQYVFQQQF